MFDYTSIRKKHNQDWKASSATKSTFFSCRGPELVPSTTRWLPSILDSPRCPLLACTDMLVVYRHYDASIHTHKLK